VSQRPGFGWIKEVVQTLALTLLIFFGIQTFVAQPYRVEQQSMERTLLPDQYVLVDKLTPRFDTYKRGDIVVFKPPPDWAQQDGTPFIKRVIGVAGDRVEVEDGVVLVNGERLSEPYVFEVDGEPQPTTTTTEPPRWTVPEGELFVMGDHRSSSSDSRTFGPIGVGDVVGRAWLRYWPADTIGVLPTPVYPELQTAAP
jgi:signal peptidase I